jgi:hypothetical protein
VWPWSDIAAIVTDIRINRGKSSAYYTRRYEISKRSGETLVLWDDRIEELSELITIVKKHAYDLMLPKAQSEWDGGSTLRFGAVVVSRDAIVAKGHRVAWREVREVVVKDGRLIVTLKQGRSIKVRASRIPNVEMLGSLIGVDPRMMDLIYL